MLVLIGLTSWKGLEKIHDGFNTWTWVSTSLVGLTLIFAALTIKPYAGGVEIDLTGKFFGGLLSILFLGWILKTRLAAFRSIRDDITNQVIGYLEKYPTQNYGQARSNNEQEI
jgi:hypothetical protein